jgi:hypothetical protein
MPEGNPIIDGGQLVFDPQVGQAVLKTLADAHRELSDQVERNFRSLSVDKLGLTAGGKAIGPFNGSVTTTGPNAFLPAHQRFLANLLTAVDAIKVAIDNYARAEQHTTQSFKPSH